MKWLAGQLSPLIEANETLLQTDKAGKIMLRIPGDDLWGGTDASTSAIGQALKARSTGEGEYAGIDGVRRMYFFAPAGARTDAGFHVSIGIDERAYVAQLNKDLLIALMFCGAVLAAAFFLTLLAGTRLFVRPIETMMNALEFLGRGNLSSRLDGSRCSGEFVGLFESFNNAAALLEAKEALIARQDADLRRKDVDRGVASQINRLIFRESSIPRLFEEACRIIVEIGGFPLSWIGTVDPGAGALSIGALWGADRLAPFEKRAVVQFQSDSADPLRKALTTSRYVICRPKDSRCASVVMPDAAGRVGAVALFPIKKGEATIGIWAIYAAGEDYFDLETVKLYSELVDDIGLAITLAEARTGGAESESAARRAESWLTAFMDNDKISAFVEDRDGKIVYASHGVGRVVGAIPAALIGRTVGEFFGPEYARQHAARNDHALATGIMGESTSNVTFGGKEVIWQVYTFPLTDGLKRGGLVGNIAFDVTDEQNAISRLKEEESKSAFMRQALNLVMYKAKLDSDVTVMTIGEEVARLTGFPPSAFLSGGNFWLSRIHPDDADAVMKQFGEIRRLGGVSLEYRWQKADGNYIWTFDKTVVTRRQADGGADEITGVWLDISERKAAEARASEANVLRNKFVNIVSHQLRTPLSSFRWSIESLLGGDYGTLSQVQKDYLSALHEVAVDIVSRIGDMLTAIDIEEGRVRVDKQELAFDALAESVVAAEKKRCDGLGIACGLSRPSKPLPAVDADSAKIRGVMEKLIDNAVSYTRRGGSVKIELSKSGEGVRFSVADTGVGIPAAEQKHVFKRFFRASNASVMKQDASGLGLAIAKHFVEEHGGRIGFESVEGKGSVFWFEIPAKKA